MVIVCDTLGSFYQEKPILGLAMGGDLSGNRRQRWLKTIVVSCFVVLRTQRVQYHGIIEASVWLGTFWRFC
jgi:hypothetical protein